MTDFKKGVVNINGLDISRNTPSADVLEKLGGICTKHFKTTSGIIENFHFENIEVLDRRFNIFVNYVMHEISFIVLVSQSNDEITEAERHEKDKQWLNKLLGEPSSHDKFGIVYKYDNVKISADKIDGDNDEVVGGCIQIIYPRKK